MESLYQLSYVSSAVYWMEQAELETLLEQARPNNHRLGVTGMLLYADGAFIQVLEGPRDSVLALYERILEDKRHTHALVIYEGSASERLFPDWKMGFRYLDRQSFERLPGFTDLLRSGSPAAEALQQKPHRCYQMLLSFSHCSSVVPPQATA